MQREILSTGRARVYRCAVSVRAGNHALAKEKLKAEFLG